MRGWFLLFAIFSFGSLSFASEEPMSLVTFPASPRVVPARLTYSNPVGEEMDVDGPWTRLELTLTNRITSPVRILGVHVKAIASEGATKDVDFTPDQFSYNIACDHGSTFAMTIDSFGEFRPGEDANLKATHTGDIPVECQGKALMRKATDFYFGGLPTSATKIYQLQITVRAIDLMTGVTLKAHTQVETH